jgi:hypothetical protein
MENIRATNLKKLIADAFDGSHTALSEKCGISISQIGQYLSGYRNIGEKTARRIEQAAGKIPGWLDGNKGMPNNDFEHGLSQQMKRVIFLMEGLDDRGQGKVLDAVVDAVELYAAHKKRIQAHPVHLEQVQIVQEDWITNESSPIHQKDNPRHKGK